jgi:hypothetical protein
MSLEILFIYDKLKISSYTDSDKGRLAADINCKRLTEYEAIILFMEMGDFCQKCIDKRIDE